MNTIAAIGALLLIFAVLLDGFETVILPRRVTRRLQPTRLFYSITWPPSAFVARHIRRNTRRENFLSFYGPLSLIVLLVLWVAALVVGFALLQWALGAELTSPDGRTDFGIHLYMSGTTFFTLGLGDVAPRSGLGRAVTVVEAGTGFGFLALVIGYLPVLYGAFSRREVNISLLDERAGSPPSATELLRRQGQPDEVGELNRLLRDWERWSAELLESHLSYPSLAYFRSQHDHQSWLSALTTILDACALVIVGVEGIPPRPAQLAFAMARHAAVDLSQVFGAPPHTPGADRLPAGDLARLRDMLTQAGVMLRTGPEADRQLGELRALYEPYVTALADRLILSLPSWIPAADAADNWQTSVWDRSAELPHF